VTAMKGSKRHVCWYVNEAPDLLNAALFSASPSLVAAASAEPKWVSPLAGDAYEEFWNERFLQRLNLLDDHLESFREFWPFKPWVNGKVSPRGTPHWDALAQVPLGGDRWGAVMVEAKAHRGELVKPNDRSKADARSLDRIRESFAKVRDYYGVAKTIPPWESRYYQFCNRLAHLWWMNERAKVTTWLVWMLIVDDPVWRDRMTAPQWYDAFQTIKSEVGLPAQHRLTDRINVVYLPAAPEAVDQSSSASSSA
jgi:hypothetical protein